MNRERIRAIIRKELREYRRNRSIVVTMAVLPLIFVIQPLIQIFVVPTSAASTLAGKDPLLYMLASRRSSPPPSPPPRWSPSASSAPWSRSSRPRSAARSSCWARRSRCSHRRSPSSYVVFGLSVASVALFAHAGIASAIVRGTPVLAQVAVHTADRRLVDLGRHRDLDALQRHPDRAAAQHPRQPPLGCARGPDRVRRDPRDTRPDRSASAWRCCSSTSGDGGSSRRCSTANDSSPGRDRERVSLSPPRRPAGSSPRRRP